MLEGASLKSDKTSILLVRFSSIGDVLLTTPVIRAMRRTWPDARISFLVKEKFSSLLRDNPHLDEVITISDSGGLSELRALTGILKQRNWTLLADLHNSLRSRFLRSVVPADYSIVYTKQAVKRSLLIYCRMDFYGRHILSIPERYIRPFERFGVRLDEEACELYPGERERYRAQEKIQARWPAGTRLLAVAPGSAWPTKRWPPASFAAAASELAHRHGLKIIMLGSEGDLEACLAVEQALDGRVEHLNLAGALPLMSSAAAVDESSLLLTNDTGLMHIATAVKTPVVAVFGPTTSHLGYFPYRAKASRVVETNLYCRPCTHNGRKRCPLMHFRCMRDIAPERVVTAATELLDNE